VETKECQNLPKKASLLEDVGNQRKPALVKQRTQNHNGILVEESIKRFQTDSSREISSDDQLATRFRADIAWFKVDFRKLFICKYCTLNSCEMLPPSLQNLQNLCAPRRRTHISLEMALLAEEENGAAQISEKFLLQY